MEWNKDAFLAEDEIAIYNEVPIKEEKSPIIKQEGYKPFETEEKPQKEDEYVCLGFITVTLPSKRKDGECTSKEAEETFIHGTRSSDLNSNVNQTQNASAETITPKQERPDLAQCCANSVLKEEETSSRIQDEMKPTRVKVEIKSEIDKYEVKVDQVKSNEVTGQGKSNEVTDQVKFGEVTDQGILDEVTGQLKSDQVTDQVKSDEVPDKTKSNKVTDQVKTGEVTDQGKSGEVTDQGKSGEVTDQGKSGEVQDETRSSGGVTHLKESPTKSKTIGRSFLDSFIGSNNEPASEKKSIKTVSKPSKDSSPEGHQRSPTALPPHLEKSRVACPLCQKDISSVHLQRHIKAIHKKHFCKTCGKIFSKGGELDKHVLKEHENEANEKRKLRSDPSKKTDYEEVIDFSEDDDDDSDEWKPEKEKDIYKDESEEESATEEDSQDSDCSDWDESRTSKSRKTSQKGGLKQISRSSKKRKASDSDEDDTHVAPVKKVKTLKDTNSKTRQGLLSPATNKKSADEFSGKKHKSPTAATSPGRKSDGKTGSEESKKGKDVPKASKTKESTQKAASDKNLYSCKFCGDSFGISDNNLYQHLEDHYIEKAEEIEESGKLTCTECREKLKKGPALHDHMKMHARQICKILEARNKPKHKCSACSQMFPSLKDLTDHFGQTHAKGAKSSKGGKS